MLLVQEALTRPKATAEPASNRLTHQAPADAGPASSLAGRECSSHARPRLTHARVRHQEGQQQLAGQAQLTSTGQVAIMPEMTSSASRDQSAARAKSVSHKAPGAGAVQTARPATESTSSTSQSECHADAALLKPESTTACNASDSSASAHPARLGALVVDQPRTAAEDTLVGAGQLHTMPCTPGADPGPLQDPGLLQEQPCTPGLVSTSSACCGLPESCSSNGGNSSSSALEAENSIRFRKRSKFEALKARREEARQKSEVPISSAMYHASHLLLP